MLNKDFSRRHSRRGEASADTTNRTNGTNRTDRAVRNCAMRSQRIQRSEASATTPEVGRSMLNLGMSASESRGSRHLILRPRGGRTKVRKMSKAEPVHREPKTGRTRRTRRTGRSQRSSKAVSPVAPVAPLPATPESIDAIVGRRVSGEFAVRIGGNRAGKGMEESWICRSESGKARNRSAGGGKLAFLRAK